MIRIINESFNKFPSWLKKFLGSKNGRSTKNSLNRLGVDLANADIDIVTKANDSRLKDPNYVVFIDLSSAGRWDNEVYVYRKSSGTGYETLNQATILDNGDYKYASKLSNKALLNMADHFAVLDLKANKKKSKERYRDPRRNYRGYNDNTGEYAGQHLTQAWTSYDGTEHPSKWVSPSGRDKSGYIIPDPAKLVGKLYTFNVDNTAKVLDNYYKKISRIKNQIFNLDFRSMGDDKLNGWNDDYSELLSSLAAVTKNYIRLERDVNNALTRLSTKASEKDLDLEEYAKAKGFTTTDELFQDLLRWEGRTQSDLDKYLYDIQSKLKKVNS